MPHDAEIRLNVWPRGRRGQLDGKGANQISVETTLPGSSLAARGCKQSCRRLRFARVMPPEALGCHDWTSHVRDTPTRGHRTPRIVIKAIQGALHILLRHYTFPLRRAASARVCVSARLDGMS